MGLNGAGRVVVEVFQPHGTDTALTGDLSRSGLHDALTLIRDLALDLVGLTCLAPEPDTIHQTDAVIRRERGATRQARDLLLPQSGAVQVPS